MLFFDRDTLKQFALAPHSKYETSSSVLHDSVKILNFRCDDVLDILYLLNYKVVS
jgi:hypothetical protein